MWHVYIIRLEQQPGTNGVCKTYGFSTKLGFINYCYGIEH